MLAVSIALHYLNLEPPLSRNVDIAAASTKGTGRANTGAKPEDWDVLRLAIQMRFVAPGRGGQTITDHELECA